MALNEPKFFWNSIESYKPKESCKHGISIKITKVIAMLKIWLNELAFTVTRVHYISNIPFSLLKFWVHLPSFLCLCCQFNISTIISFIKVVYDLRTSYPRAVPSSRGVDPAHLFFLKDLIPMAWPSYVLYSIIPISFQKAHSIPPLKHSPWDFPGSPVVKTSPSSAGGAGSIPGWGAKMPHASQPKNQNTKQKQYCNKFNKGFKNGPHQKNVKIKKNSP